jgi:hypothetical protein
MLNPEMCIKGLKLMWIKKKFKSSSKIIQLLSFSENIDITNLGWNEFHKKQLT